MYGIDIAEQLIDIAKERLGGSENVEFAITAETIP